jgi:hypothetical protein
MTDRLPAVISPNTITTRQHAPDVVPALIAAAGERASLRSLEFFAATIRNPHTRRAYGRAVAGFMTWCDDNHVPSIAAVQPLHVAAWVEQQTRDHSAPTAKLRLAALRHLFDWLVTGQVMPTNLAGSVRGPAHVVKAGKTAVLAPEDSSAPVWCWDWGRPFFCVVCSQPAIVELRWRLTQITPAAVLPAGVYIGQARFSSGRACLVFGLIRRRRYRGVH